MCSCPSLLLQINLCQGEQSWFEQVNVTMHTKSSRGWLLRTRQSFLIQRPHVRGGGARMPRHVLMSILLLDMNGSAIYLPRRYSWSEQVSTTKFTKTQGGRGSHAHAKTFSDVPLAETKLSGGDAQLCFWSHELSAQTERPHNTLPPLHCSFNVTVCRCHADLRQQGRVRIPSD